MKFHKHIKFIFSYIIIFQANINAELNQFGLSDLTIPTKTATSKKNEITSARIQEELGKNFTLQDIFTLLTKMHEFYEHLLNTQNDNKEDWQILKNALRDVKKAKMLPYIKPTQVTPEDEHYLRVEIGKLERLINPIK